mmetsp:Transcript_92238/g.266215  ORF Transcript_92238/g.266215 Transcript_92238/m.266215 type:complete len:306 (-) Transcript_92238:37-954(-)
MQGRAARGIESRKVCGCTDKHLASRLATGHGCPVQWLHALPIRGCDICTTGDQRFASRLVTTMRRQVQRRPTAVRLDADHGRVPLQQHGDCPCPSHGRSLVNREEPALVLRPPICAVVQQRSDSVERPGMSGPMKRRLPGNVAAVSIRAGGQEVVDDGGVVRLACGVQRRLPGVVPHVGACTAVHEELRQVGVAAHRRHVEWRALVEFDGHVDRTWPIQQQRISADDVACDSSLPKACLESGGLDARTSEPLRCPHMVRRKRRPHWPRVREVPLAGPHGPLDPVRGAGRGGSEQLQVRKVVWPPP